MSNQRAVDTTRTPSVVTHVIKIDGNNIPERYKADAIIISKETNRVPSAKVIINDGDSSDESFRASNDKLFIPGSEIEIHAGYESDNHLLFKGIIIKHSIKIRSNNSLLIIDCKDKSIKMTVGLKNKYFAEDIKDSEAISELCESYGLETDIEATSISRKELVQYESTDWDFMLCRADVNGKLCFADDGKITVKQPDLTQDSIIQLRYGATILELDAEIDARQQFQSVISKAWNSDNQEIAEKEASNPSVNLNGNLEYKKLSDAIGLASYNLHHSGNLTDSELQAWGDAFWYKHQLAKVRGSVRFRGTHTVKPGMLIDVNGVGDRFNGKCFISGITHNISAGEWQLDVQLGLDPQWFSSRYNDISAKPASGVLPSINGLQIGKVTQLEEDPEGRCRIKVYLPIISPTDQGIWARVATLDAGNERGTFFLPEVGDEVIVGFINDDPRDAVILGMLNSSANPAPIKASDKNDEKGFVTRAGIKMIFNDKDESYTLETPAGKKIIIDDNKGVLSLEDENSNKLKMDSKGITIESGSDLKIKAKSNISIEGINVDIKGSAAVTCDGGSSIEVKSNGTTTVNGSIVNIN